MRKLLFILAAMVLGSIGLHAENTITYTATEKLSGYEGSLNKGAFTFGHAITSHEFSNGIGTITCAGEITKIGDRAFWYCANLTSVTIPNSVATIGSWAFTDCTNLTSIEIPNFVTTIGGSAFYYCTGLKTVTIGNSVTTIGESAFMYCSGLTSITIPNSVTTIGRSVFERCSNLTFIDISNSVTTIGAYVFYDCSKLETIYCYAPNPPTLGGLVFNGVPTGNLSVYVFDIEAYKNKWTQLPASCFKPISAVVGDFKYEFLVENNQYKARVIAKDGGYTQSTITIPEQITYDGLTFIVTEIGQSAFEGCNNLTSVTIPVSVKEIGAWAFKNCTQLKDLQFADRTDAINIGIYAFENMALTEVIIPDWMTDISEGLFFSNTKLTAIYLPEQVNTIGHRPFGACPLEYIISMSETPPALPVGEAFEGYNKDASVIVYVPSMDAVVAYQKSDWNKYFTNFITNNTYRILSASSGTAELVSVIPDEKEKTISIPSVIAIDGDYYRVIGIGDEAFKDNTVLQSISLPPTIQYIGNSAFGGCTQLKQTNSRFWEDLQTIGDSAFYGCSALDSIVIPEAVQTIGKRAFMECKNLTSISLPTGLKNIPDECFHKCPLGTEIIVPEGVETIGKYAFEGNSEARLKAKSITLPSTLKEINLGAFYLHDGLKTITCRALIPPTLTEQAFASKEFQEQQITVYVPNRDVMAAYRDDKNQWGSDIYNFSFTDLMAEENKQYLNTVAGNNDEAKTIAALYCDSIDDANSVQEVQDLTNDALDKIDKLTLEDYKKQLIESLKKTARENIEALQIVEQYKTQIENAYFRLDAEQLFKEAEKKINDIFALINLKADYKQQLISLAKNDPDLLKVAADYGVLIDLAETKEQADALFYKAQQRMEINKQIKEDWKGLPVKVSGRDCSTTQKYLDNH